MAASNRNPPSESCAPDRSEMFSLPSALGSFLILRFSASRRVTGEHQVALFHLLVAREAGLHERVVNWFAVAVEMTEPPTTSRGVLLGVLDHELNVGRIAGHKRLLTAEGFVVLCRGDESVVQCGNDSAVRKRKFPVAVCLDRDVVAQNGCET